MTDPSSSDPDDTDCLDIRCHRAMESIIDNAPIRRTALRTLMAAIPSVEWMADAERGPLEEALDLTFRRLLLRALDRSVNTEALFQIEAFWRSDAARQFERAIDCFNRSYSLTSALGMSGYALPGQSVKLN